MSKPKETALIRSAMDGSIRRLIEDLRTGDSSQNSNLVALLTAKFGPPTVDRVWHDAHAAVTHWLLLLNGVHHADEQKLAEALLFWREFSGGASARVRCIQSSDHDMFRFASKLFKVNSPPVLVVSADPDFTQCLKFDGALLAKLSEKKGGLQRFLVNVHTCMLNGWTIEELQTELSTDKFWEGVKLVYKEVKGFFSIQISN